jgi:hypothetical protein
MARDRALTGALYKAVIQGAHRAIYRSADDPLS